MENEIILKVKELKEKIKDEQWYKAVLDAEKKMNSDEESVHLLILYRSVASEYEDAIKRDLPTTKIQKRIEDITLQLYANPFISEYIELSSRATEKLKEISNILCKDIVSENK